MRLSRSLLVKVSIASSREGVPRKLKMHLFLCAMFQEQTKIYICRPWRFQSVWPHLQPVAGCASGKPGPGGPDPSFSPAGDELRYFPHMNQFDNLVFESPFSQRCHFSADVSTDRPPLPLHLGLPHRHFSATCWLKGLNHPGVSNAALIKVMKMINMSYPK